MTKFIGILVFFFVVICLHAQSDRSIDGFGNNRDFPERGSAGSVMPSWVSNGFQDSISAPGGAFRPNPRLISNMIFDQEESISDENLLTEYVWAFGQFVDHDISLVEKNTAEYIPIGIPQNDLFFEPGASIPFFRSYAAIGSGISSSNPRSYENKVTSFIDASQIYGSDEQRSNSLRTFEKGKLKSSQNNLLPWNTVNHEFNSPVDALAPAMDNDVGLSNKLFLAGDVRANEHPLLISLHTIFLREHNRLCDSLVQKYPHWEDELIFQNARKMVGALIQSVVYDEWLPAMGIELDNYQGYEKDIDPGISNVFSAAAFRLGHSMINDDLVRITEHGDTILQGNLLLRDAFFNPVEIALAGGIEPYLLGINGRPQQKLDYKIVDGVRNFLFGDPSDGGLDLAATNIMRGRDRGIPDYNTLRNNFGLDPILSFSDLRDEDSLVYLLTFLYGNVDNIDAWVGMLLEEHMEGKSIGSLLYTILKKQFTNLRDADRYYFENDPTFSENDIISIKNTKLSDIILRNSKIQDLPENLFILNETEHEKEGPELANSDLDVIIYPNPSLGNFDIKFYLVEDAEIDISFVDLYGRHLEIIHFNGSEGINKYRFNINQALPSGTYFVFIRSPKNYKTLKIRYDKRS